VVDVDPTRAILDEVSRTAGHVMWLQERLALWNMDTDEAVPAKQSSWLVVYQAERRHLAQICKMAIDAGVAQRAVALAERQGAQLAEAINKILDGLGLSDTQKQLVPTVVPQVLRAIAVRTDQEAT
jgi:hypothetical protein